ncbi:M3 family oligoendopeptidase [Candidatus Parcubacteria bacterium]|uniref:Oligoendopeptidase F n=1 Tax=Candidatus Kaiserbacteria bacterium CG10_big_fil_rev_8_21_14_0_10_47_16 TaxID=1974608 RepID=A0A2H0UDF8_9BACT|nr:M3 family oligoendopeptidase [Candidatus Parcubacteria bacterium]PIR84432.1 MAG: hypothetical protein COU16_02525 [Candidatus Kaiserbacteria bacterium CG10_big_fil_rev_8_21_14_0_10_47_16]
MSKKKHSTAKKTFAYTPTQKLPTLGKVQTSWNLAHHYYRSEKDPKIEKDVAMTEKTYHAFAKKYKGKDFTSTAKKLLPALKEYETLAAMPEAARASRYFAFRHEVNAKDHVAEKRGNLLDDRLTKVGNEIIFFTLVLGKIPTALQKKYLAEPTLAKYRYFLSRVFLEAKHTLTEAEERIMSLRSSTSYGMWVSGTSKILSNRTIVWKKNTIAIPEALEEIEMVAPEEKQKLWELILNEMEQIGEVAENEFNAIVTHKKVSDELRAYKEPYSATIEGYENNEKSVMALVNAISTKGFDLSKKFYKLKAKYHKKAKIPYINKYDSIGVTPAIPFEKAVEICRDVFYGLKKEYGEIFDRMLTDGSIDVYPKSGKRGGAFMSAAVNMPTFVFLNHTNNFKSLETLAHEMGHAIHAERSKGQPTIYQDFSTVTAETASTLFEQLVGDAILAQATAEDARVFLHDRIGRDIATIQRQIAFFNYELDVHRTIREHGAVTKEELQKMMQKHLQAYLGPAVDVTYRDGASYVYIPHFRYGFYVYSYAYGILMSSIMARRFKADSSYITNIDAFLCAGGSDTVENIFGSIGIDATKTKTFLESLESLEQDIVAFGKLIG